MFTAYDIDESFKITLPFKEYKVLDGRTMNDAKKLIEEADFIFLCEWDKMEIGEALHEMPWGWPQEFDSIFVGSPEGKDFPWDADRWLYYRK